MSAPGGGPAPSGQRPRAGERPIKTTIPKGYPPGTVAFDRKPSAQRAIAGLPEFVFGAVFAAGWFSPAGLTERIVAVAAQAMAVEALLVHANTMLGWRVMSADRRRQLRLIALFGLFYVVFGAALSVAFKSLGPLLIVVGFSVSRTWSALADPPPSEFAQRTWYHETGMNLGLYVLLMIVTAFVPLPFAGGFPGVVSEPMLWTDGWDWEVERLVPMAAAFYLMRGFATMWAWPRRIYLLPTPPEMR